jgi:hypothetical protein
MNFHITFIANVSFSNVISYNLRYNERSAENIVCVIKNTNENDDIGYE